MTTIYEKIETLRNLRNIPKMKFYKLLGMSDVGYNKAISNNSLKLITLEKIAEILDTPLEELVSKHKPDIANKPNEATELNIKDLTIDSNSKIELYELRLKQLLQKIDFLESELRIREKMMGVIQSRISQK